MSEILGKDIRTFKGDIQFSNSQDFSFITGENNLTQAIYTRLRTIINDYNINYGSELTKTFGNPRGDLTRTQLIGYISECLKQEPRIMSIKDIEIDYPVEDERLVTISISVLSIDSQVPLNLVYPLFL